MDLDMIPLISFVIITTFTPGPNNISSASMGISYGFRKTVNYLVGIASGFFVVMMTCAFLGSTLLSMLPSAERYLRWIGACYILWLALGILRSDISDIKSNGAPMAFAKGFALQLFNPKVAVYGLALYSTFLSPIADHFGYLTLSAVAFAFTAFMATSTWALFGATLKTKLKNGAFRHIMNISLSMVLIYTALELSGVLLLK